MNDFKQIKPKKEKEILEPVKKPIESVLIPQIKTEEEKKVDGGELQQGGVITSRWKNMFSRKSPVKKEKKISGEKKPGMSPEKIKRLKIAGIIVGVIFLLILIPSLLVMSKAKKLISSTNALVEAGKAQNINNIKTELENTKTSLKKLRGSYVLLSWTRIIPFFGRYVSDGSHALAAAEYGFDAMDILIKTAEPYADILGFESDVLGEETEGDGEKTARERIDFIAKTIPDLVPQIDELSEKMTLVKKEFDHIDPSRYPKKFGKTFVRERLKKGIDLINLSEKFIREGKPLLEQAPYLLGIDGARQYLVLFQNDKELRPTGGFMTAYSIMKVEDAKFEPVLSSDIYSLDAKYKPTVDAPDPIIDYLKGPYLLDERLRLRDMNWSPDFYESMKLFSEEAESVGITDVDGIIAVDTEVVVKLLEVIGPIGVPGFGNFTAEDTEECRCPQVVFELESFADNEGPVVWDPDGSGRIIFAPPNYDNRKKIIGPLMNSILANAMAQPKEKLADLFQTGIESLMEKHVLLFMHDKKAQAAVESFGIAGTIKQVEGDYLHINDSNLGGRKSNIYVTQEVVQDIEVAKDGTVTKTLSITYKNSEEHDGWLNSVLPNWVRIYVPEGSELIDISGLEDKKDPYTELGKTVFAGFFELRPKGVSKVTLTYKLPFKVKDDYKLFLQKQPGTGMPLHTINIKKTIEEFFLLTDKEFRFGI